MGKLVKSLRYHLLKSTIATIVVRNLQIHRKKVPLHKPVTVFVFIKNPGLFQGSEIIKATQGT